MRRFIYCFLMLFCCVGIAEPLPVGKSSFSFEDRQLNPKKPLHVLIYKPSQIHANSHIVFVMTGITRDGERYFQDWQFYAEQQGFILIVPVFTKMFYSDQDYTLRMPFKKISSLANFHLIEKIFDEIKNREHLNITGYALYGHSAGGQFVHRFLLLFAKNSRADIMIAANSGFYTLPFINETPDHLYPYSLASTQISDEGLKSIFHQKFFLLLGENDIDPGAKNLNRLPQAKAQGKSRLERGMTFFRIAEEQAKYLNTSFNWRLITVPGVGHNNKGMAKTAARLISEYYQ